MLQYWFLFVTRGRGVIVWMLPVRRLFLRQLMVGLKEESTIAPTVLQRHYTFTHVVMESRTGALPILLLNIVLAVLVQQKKLHPPAAGCRVV
jgi:hypothetical protein